MFNHVRKQRLFCVARLIVFIIGLSPTLHCTARTFSVEIERSPFVNEAVPLLPILWSAGKEVISALVRTTVADVLGPAVVQLGTLGGTGLAASQVPVIVPLAAAALTGAAIKITDKETNQTIISINDPKNKIQQLSDTMMKNRVMGCLSSGGSSGGSGSSGSSATPASTTPVTTTPITVQQSTPTVYSSELTQITPPQSQSVPSISFSNGSVTGLPGAQKFSDKIRAVHGLSSGGSSGSSAAPASTTPINDVHITASQGTSTIQCSGGTQTTPPQSNMSISNGSAAGAPDSPPPPRYTVITSKSRPTDIPTDSSITTTSAQSMQDTVVMETPTTTSNTPTYKTPTLAQDIASNASKSAPVNNTITITDSNGSTTGATGFSAKPDIKTMSSTTNPTGSSITTSTGQPTQTMVISETTPITPSGTTCNPPPLAQSIPRNEGGSLAGASTTTGKNVFKDVSSPNSNPLSPTETLTDRTLKPANVPSRNTMKGGARVSGSSTYLTQEQQDAMFLEQSRDNTLAQMRADPQNAPQYAAEQNARVHNLNAQRAHERAELARNQPCEAARNHPNGDNIYYPGCDEPLSTYNQERYEKATHTRPEDIQARIDYKQAKQEMMGKKAAKRAAQQAKKDAQQAKPTTEAKPTSNKSKASSGGEVASPMPDPELPPGKDKGKQQSTQQSKPAQNQQAKPTQSQAQQSQNQSANNTANNQNITPAQKTTGTASAIVTAIRQFSEAAIEEGVNYVMKNPNNIRHIFVAKHKLAQLVAKLGSQEAVVRAVLNAADGKLPIGVVFKDLPVNVEGFTVFVRGIVIDGIPKLGTFFIP